MIRGKTHACFDVLLRARMQQLRKFVIFMNAIVTRLS